MNKIEGKREIDYQLAMSVARRMLLKGLIIRDDYKKFEDRMSEKYTPIIGRLFSRLTCNSEVSTGI